MSEVLIIGSGMAAVAAALEAKARGAEVTVLTGSPGATALSSGAWDIAGDPRRQTGDFLPPPPPRTNLEVLLRSRADHPYQRIKRHTEGIVAFLKAKVEEVSAALDFPLVGSLDETFLALTPMGTLKGTAFVPRSVGSGNIRLMGNARLLIVGIKGLSAFSPAGATSILQKITGGHLASITPATLDLGTFTSPFELAQKLDGEWQNALLAELERVVRASHATHMALPPVMGLKTTAQLLSRIHEALKVQPFETLALAPSIPGWRLQQAIDHLIRRNFKVMTGRAVAFSEEGNKIRSLETNDGHKIAVDRVVLTTGKFLSGGLIKDKQCSEPLFHLPVGLQGKEIGKTSLGALVHRPFLSDHDLFSVGVITNDRLQPAQSSGHIPYQNLWAAGSILSGSNPAIDHSGMGVALGTGTLAGRMATT